MFTRQTSRFAWPVVVCGAAVIAACTASSGGGGRGGNAGNGGGGGDEMGEGGQEQSGDTGGADSGGSAGVSNTGGARGGSSSGGASNGGTNNGGARTGGAGSGGTNAGGAGGVATGGTPGTGGTGGTPSGVPIMVAYGDGGWTMVSCDRGRRWKVNGAVGDVAAAPWAGGAGVSFGNGRFVGGLGHAGGGHVITSTDGVVWSEVPGAQFMGNTQTDGVGFPVAGLGFDGTAFTATGYPAWRSTDGLNWTRFTLGYPPGVQQIRKFRVFPGVMVTVVETQNGSEHAVGFWTVASENGGATWYEGTGTQINCLRGAEMEMVGKTLITVLADVCRSTDHGRTWEYLTAPAGGGMRGLFNDGTAFFALQSDRVMRSTDGKVWQMYGTKLPMQGSKGAVQDGHFVVMNDRASRVYHGENATNWQEVTPSAGVDATNVSNIGVGRGPANAMCPNP